MSVGEEPRVDWKYRRIDWNSLVRHADNPPIEAIRRKRIA